MEIAIALMGVALAILGIILGYIWRTNGRYMRALTEGQLQIVKGIERVSQIVEKVDQRQVEMAKALQWIAKHFAEE